MLPKRQGFPSRRRYVGGPRHIVDIPLRGLRPLGAARGPQLVRTACQVAPRLAGQVASTEP